MRKRVTSEPAQTDDGKVPARRFRFLTLEEFEALSTREKAEYVRAAQAATLEREKNAIPPPKIWD